MTDDVVIRNRARQIEWYGEPLHDRFRRLLDRLRLPQSALAEVLGLSAPMLSQLMSGQRAKISNPAVVSRLMAVEALAAEPGFALLSADEVRERLDQVRSQNTTPSYLSVPTVQHPAPATRSADPVAGIQALLRGLASAAEIEDAARLIEPHHPDLATMLRVYGNGRTADARAHYARVMDDS
ncbi:DNA-binding protein [Actinoallomurus acaciae]|uniref:DNA-binding protein n=1 Tax=Actinoallomurus acaciae TaxID=502577 RepID=A0ABV5YQ87_9ACTN